MLAILAVAVSRSRWATAPRASSQAEAKSNDDFVRCVELQGEIRQLELLQPQDPTGGARFDAAEAARRAGHGEARGAGGTERAQALQSLHDLQLMEVANMGAFEMLGEEGP